MLHEPKILVYTRGMTEITSETPFERFKKTYTPLYRVLLILGVLAIFMSLAALTNLRTILNYFTSDPVYAISGTVSALVVPAFMIASLILLWKKHPTGLRLRLVGYAISIGASLLALFTSKETLTNATREVIEAAVRDGNGAITKELATSLTHASFYGSLYVSVGLSLLFAWLWWKAWKRQMKVDHKKSASSQA